MKNKFSNQRLHSIATPPGDPSEAQGDQSEANRYALEKATGLTYIFGMPELSRFLGIVIGIFPREHQPPHFHAVYGDYQITVDIQSGIVHGDFPKRALRHVLEWLDLHQNEILENWNLIQAGQPASKIAPLE